MSFKSILCGVAAALTLTTAAQAGDMIHIMDPYARTARPNAPTGAAFMGIMNMSPGRRPADRRGLGCGQTGRVAHPYRRGRWRHADAP